MNYNQIVSALQRLTWTPKNDSDFNFKAILPATFDYANNRIYRELDFLPMWQSTTAAMVVNNRNLAVPTAVVVLDSINAISPAATTPDNGTRNPVERVSIDALNFLWPMASLVPALPTKFAIIGTGTAMSVLFSPTPNAAYNAELVGIVRPTPLGASTTTTYITDNYADLFIAACMIYLSGYERDFGAESDDPSRAQSWSSTYNDLRTAAMIEAARQRGQGAQWSTDMPPVVANYPRENQGAR